MQKPEPNYDYLMRQANGCQTCGSLSQTRYIKFYKNIGMLIMRRYYFVEGKLCKSCINRYFWNYSLVTLFLGWWGTISFFVTPLILLNNIGRYLFTLITVEKQLEQI